MSKAIAGKKAAAFSAAFAIALSAGVVGADATVAQAAEGTAADAQQNDVNAPYSLHIHKHKGTSSAQQGNGEEQTLPATNEAVDGVKFQVELVKDLSGEKQSDMKAAADLAKTEAKDYTGEATVVGTGETENGGTYSLNLKKKGLYRVTELEVPTTSKLAKAKPFWVFVPMTNSDGNGWLNDVHAYPKNSEITVTKKVIDQDKHNGQTYDYVINSTVPAVADTQNPELTDKQKEERRLTKYHVVDVLDDQLDAAGATVDVKYKGEGLDEDTDYELVKNGQEIIVKFLAEGLAKLDDSQQQVETTIHTRTKTLKEDGDGKLDVVKYVPNTAKLISNHPYFDSEQERTSTPVETFWGSLKVIKYDGDKKEGEEGRKLKGAEFQIVQCQDEKSVMKINGEDTWKTGEDGAVIIRGIHATDFADNADAEADYCLKESKAPEGFVKSDELTKITLKKEDIAKHVDSETNRPVDANGEEQVEQVAKVANYTSKTFLPNTGGAGFIAIVMAGLAIIGGGFFAARRNSVKA